MTLFGSQAWFDFVQLHPGLETAIPRVDGGSTFLLAVAREILWKPLGGWLGQTRMHEGQDEVVHIRHHQDFLGVGEKGKLSGLHRHVCSEASGLQICNSAGKGASVSK